MSKRTESAAPLTVKAPAKVNLYLEVVGRRPDGYHDLRTIMQTVNLCDELTFAPRPDAEITLDAAGAGLPPAGDNLVLRAARLLQEQHAPQRGADIALRKAIPVGGGLGGGSSDAAATLKALNRLWELGLGTAQLEGLAAQLGSDVPFFIRGGTALCEGRGERVTPLPVKGRCAYVLVLPDVRVSTQEVYAEFDNDLTLRLPRATIEEVQSSLTVGNMEQLGRNLRNDLQVSAVRISPEVARIYELLAEATHRVGAEGVCLSGSGSSFLVLFASPDRASEAARELPDRVGVRTVMAQSLPPA